MMLKYFDFSVAIMRYIAIKFNVPEHWFPRKDVQKAAKIDEFLNWQHLNIRKWELEIVVNTVSTVYTRLIRREC